MLAILDPHQVQADQRIGRPLLRERAKFISGLLAALCQQPVGGGIFVIAGAIDWTWRGTEKNQAEGANLVCL
jgi:hypothetical protein